MYPTYAAYREAWKNAYISDPPIPLNIDIELASVCNLSCPMCFYGEAEWNAEMSKPATDGKPKKRLMPTEMALSVIDQAAEIGVPALKFNWRGESTMHPDYSEILEYARSWAVMQKLVRNSNPYPSTLSSEFGEWKQMQMTLKPDGKPYVFRTRIRQAFHEILVNTNANCKDHAIDGLMAATKCMVSLDSTIPEIYAVQRKGGRLERAIEVIKELIRRKHPNLWIRRVITKENSHESFKKRVDEIFGGTGYKVSEHHCMDRGDGIHQTHNPEKYERTYCGYPSQRIMVASDGTCYPCCVDTDGTMSMGDFKKQNLLEIWNGEHFKRLRIELRGNEFSSKICRKCESWMSYKSEFRNNVQDKEITDG